MPNIFLHFILPLSIELVINEKSDPLEIIVFGEGKCFGEMSVIDIQPHTTTVITVEDSNLIVFIVAEHISVIAENRHRAV